MRIPVTSAIIATLAALTAAAPSHAQTYYARETLKALPKPAFPDTWVAKVQRTSSWSSCANSVMSTQNIDVTCDGSSCDPSTKPTKLTETCQPKSSCKSFTSGTYYHSCESTRFIVNPAVSAATFCSYFANAKACSVIASSGTQITACIDGTPVQDTAKNVSGGRCG